MQASGTLLAAARPPTGSDTLLFEASLDTEVTQIFFCNITGSAATFRLHHVVAGGSVAQENALFYDKSIAANDTFRLVAEVENCGIKLAEGDALWVRSPTGGSITYSAYGITAHTAPRGV
jgi:hypothetical protein